MNGPTLALATVCTWSEVGGAGFGQAIFWSQDHFAGNVADHGGERRDGHFAQHAQNRVSRQDQDGLFCRAP
jgi:hypothetical protein